MHPWCPMTPHSVRPIMTPPCRTRLPPSVCHEDQRNLKLCNCVQTHGQKLVITSWRFLSSQNSSTGHAIWQRVAEVPLRISRKMAILLLRYLCLCLSITQQLCADIYNRTLVSVIWPGCCQNPANVSVLQCYPVSEFGSLACYLNNFPSFVLMIACYLKRSTRCCSQLLSKSIFSSEICMDYHLWILSHHRKCFHFFVLWSYCVMHLFQLMPTVHGQLFCADPRRFTLNLPTLVLYRKFSII